MTHAQKWKSYKGMVNRKCLLDTSLSYYGNPKHSTDDKTLLYKTTS